MDEFELEKLISGTTLEYAKQAEEAYKQLLGLSGLTTSTDEVELRIKQLQSILGHNEISNAFQLKSDYEKMVKYINSTIDTKNLVDLSTALGTDFSDYLKPEYNTSLHALDSFKESIGLAQANHISSIGDYWHDAEKVLLGFKDNSHLLDSAKQLSSIASQIDSDIFKKQLNNIELSIEQNKLSNYDVGLQPELKHITDFQIPRFEDSPLGQQNQKLIEHSEKQITVLSDMSNYLLKQTKHTELQNEIMSQQIKSSEKTANEARSWVIVTLIVSVLVSLGIFFAQDDSDEKNHKQLISAIKNKEFFESQWSQLQIQVANENKLIELMGQQNGYLNKLQIGTNEKINTNKTEEAK